MDDSLLMQVSDTSKHLVRERFEVSVGELELLLREDACQVVVHVLEDHVHRAVWNDTKKSPMSGPTKHMKRRSRHTFRDHHLMKLDDVLVAERL